VVLIKKKFLVLFLLLSFLTLGEQKMVIVTASDTEYYPWLCHLIDAIKKHHETELQEIAVFNLGLLKEEKSKLSKIRKVKIFEIEKTHPNLLKKYVTTKEGKLSRGWFAWKPVVLKQACQLYPIFLYLDTGIVVKKSLSKIFEIIERDGYMLFDCGHSIKKMATQYIIKNFEITPQLLNKRGISGGIQGISRKIFDTYIMPIYKLSFDLKNFKDDGTAPEGFGWARHDQTLFSLYARKLNLRISSLPFRTLQRQIKDHP
jgi:hypothetical protein